MSINSVLPKLRVDYPAIQFVAGSNFSWSPSSQKITYKTDTNDTDIPLWALLHEVGHADLGHQDFDDDIGLLALELSAWNRASEIARDYGVVIDSEHIQDCLDTYRDWLHARASCPTCGVVSLQRPDGIYQCFNCKTSWKVPKSQLCRVRRTVLKAK